MTNSFAVLKLSLRKSRLRIIAAFAVAIGACMSASAQENVVELPSSSASRSGIETRALASAQYAPQVEGIASVTDPQPLLALAAQLAASKAAMCSATAQAFAAEAQANRLEALYRNDKMVSAEDEQAAVAAAAAAKAQQFTAVANDASAQASARANWGSALATLAERGPRVLADYAEGRSVLLSVALPVGTTGSPGNEIRLRLPGGVILTATLIGPSPQADTVVQGLTYFYRTPGGQLRSGQRYTALVPMGPGSGNGVVVPDSAVVWYGGEPWAYVEPKPGQYERRHLSLVARDINGWFEAKGFRAGEQVVVHGAELLLTQELKPPASAKAGSGEDDDD